MNWYYRWKSLLSYVLHRPFDCSQEWYQFSISCKCIYESFLLHLQDTLTIKLKATMKNTSPAAQLLNWSGHRIIIFACRKDSKKNNFIALFFLVGT